MLQVNLLNYNQNSFFLTTYSFYNYYNLIIDFHYFCVFLRRTGFHFELRSIIRSSILLMLYLMNLYKYKTRIVQFVYSSVQNKFLTITDYKVLDFIFENNFSMFSLATPQQNESRLQLS